MSCNANNFFKGVMDIDELVVLKHFNVIIHAKNLLKFLWLFRNRPLC